MENSLKTVVLAAGCFWCLDSVARRLSGVHSVRSVYTGGTGPAVYEAVASGGTGHAEAVEISYDPAVLPDQVLHDVFFSSHDPTTLNRQGYDVGTQYRSAMFYSTEDEHEEFAAAIQRAQDSFDQPIVTTLEPLGPVYEAEEVHQDFHSRRPEVGYCQVIIDPKVAKLRRDYASWLKPEEERSTH
ncbi:peptide-methionine (S)-S-oxide reductase MsrA [Nesterenkonia halotolerans]|uniref:Peptide methionine sulfoxide reductase MsrA n=1 Tax=Nesterenkonia halotolerans TaxID=225325 RepID=A0ABR9J3B7_9MICC|nr:peptide-methionine (S)-S-oxide reductase MsrA [Nesterenkonia halotolerans]MBE1513503.1 peptide-methionine (S)-S-oxide reductase [Nesterenkonia halotolerans]